MDSLSEIFSLLTEERRRFVLYYLDTADEGVSVDELAQQVYEWEEDPSREEIPAEAYRETMISLTHSDLPKIDDADQVTFDRTSGEIRITDMSAEAELILSVSEAIERSNGACDIVVEKLG